MAEVTKTRWGTVITLLLAGMISALQVSKVAIALPELQHDFSLSLFVAASAIGAYSVLGAALGMPLGFLLSLVSARRAVLAGFVIAALGSFLGADAINGELLVAARIVEGCGFLATVLSIPPLLRRAAAPRDLDTIMSLWSAYLPSGAAIMMLAGPAVLELGWRVLWIGNGALSLAAAVILFFLPVPDVAAPSGAKHFQYAGAVLRSKTTFLLALIFALYTFQFMAMGGLLPTLLVQRAGLSVASAGWITALIWIVNAVGNVSAGLLLRTGAPMWTLVLGAFALMGVAAFGVFSANLPLIVIVVLACTSLGLTGLIPGSVFAAAARTASAPAMLVLTLGLINQGSNIGTLLGPATLGFLVQNFGWDSAWLLFAAVAVCGMTTALGLRAAFAPSSNTASVPSAGP
jgi:predicted MFS family arabinose efflux permease